jgi:hypothetical protein
VLSIFVRTRNENVVQWYSGCLSFLQVEKRLINLVKLAIGVLEKSIKEVGAESQRFKRVAGAVDKF